MNKVDFDPQSYKWPAVTVMSESELPQYFSETIKNIGVFSVAIAKDGNRTILRLSETDATQSVAFVKFSGEIIVSKFSKAEAHLFLVSTGSWSGGSNYYGVVVGFNPR